MVTLEGIGTSEGLASGKILMIGNENDPPEKITTADAGTELRRLHRAMEKAKLQIEELHGKAVKEAGENDASIFEIHAMMLEDSDYQDAIESAIRKGVNAEYAVYITGRDFAGRFNEMEDEYMRERSADVTDVSRRLIRVLAGNTDDPLKNVKEKVVVAADELMPSQTIQLDKTKIAAFVTRGGSKISHSSILARSKGIPAVVALNNGFRKLRDGGYAIVDGTSGIVILDPDVITSIQYTQKEKSLRENKIRLEKIRGTPAVTLDGRRIQLCCNIGNPEEVQAALENDAEGIGLFRSEFLFLGKRDFPTEEEQFQAYRSVLTAMGKKRVVIRTLDLGADKQAPYFNIPKEDNPALGYRAIRIQLDRVDLLTAQLRALYRASAYGKLAIMFPMIVSVYEVQTIRGLAESVRKKLSEEGTPYDPNVELGIMVETPAAAILADRLAAEVDFFSIGTNDLTQYTYAADRMNSKVSYLFDSGGTAVMRLIRRITEQAHRHGIWVGICGESAADPKLTEYYLHFGVDELSVSPPALLGLKAKIQSLRISSVQDRLDKSLE